MDDVIKVMLVDDHLATRRILKDIIDHEPDMTVEVESENGADALSFLRIGIKTDVMISDIIMPEMDGFRLTKHVIEEFPDVKVVICSMLDHPLYVQKALDAGAVAYLIKGSPIDELLSAIRLSNAV